MSKDAQFDEACSFESSRRSRHWLHPWLSQWYLPSEELADEVLLVLSEFVTNAVAADSRRVAVGASAHLRTLRLEVADDAVGMPVRRDPNAGSVSGRGLGTVAAAASAWGVTARDGRPGKSLWAQFDVPELAAAGFDCDHSPQA